MQVRMVVRIISGEKISRRQHALQTVRQVELLGRRLAAAKVQIVFLGAKRFVTFVDLHAIGTQIGGRKTP